MDYEQKTIMIRADVLQRFEIAARMRDETLTLDRFVEAKLIEFSNRVFAEADEASGYQADDDLLDEEFPDEAPEDIKLFAYARDIDKRMNFTTDAPTGGGQTHHFMPYNQAAFTDPRASEAKKTEENIHLAKMRSKIKKWSEKRDSYPFMIISAYFRCKERSDGVVVSSALYDEVIAKHPEKSRREVQNNFAQLKTTSGHAHGAVFVQLKKGQILPVDSTEAVLCEYRDKFVEND